MSKVAFIATHQISLEIPVGLHQCLGVLTLAAGLSKKSIDFEVIDLIGFNKIAHRNFDELIDFIIIKILETGANILALSTMTCNLIFALEICRRIKEKHLFTILGGPGVSYCAEEIVTSFPEVDVIIRGEADKAFPEFIDALVNNREINKIEGLVYRKDNKIIDYGWPEPIDDLDSLPFPLYELCSSRYIEKLNPGKNYALIESGRGCPFNCTFCSSSNFFKKKYRYKSIERLMEEIKIVQKYNINYDIIFNHDMLTSDHKYVEKLCNSLKKETPSVKWHCYSRIDTIDPELLVKMCQAGCKGIFFGIEVATERMQRIIKKNLGFEKIDILLNTIIDLDCEFIFSFITGLPEETEEDLEAMIIYLMKIRFFCPDKIKIVIFQFIPEAGSYIYEKWKKSLTFDSQAIPPFTFIPSYWERAKEIIKNHPSIFPGYFYIKDTTMATDITLRYLYLGLMIEGEMSSSLQLAYNFLGDKLPVYIAKNIRHLELSFINSMEKIDYPLFMKSLRKLILEISDGNSNFIKKYDTLAQYEIAGAEVLKNRTKSFSRLIEIHYDPKELMDNLFSEDIKEKRHFLLIYRDEPSKKVLYNEMSENFTKIISNRKE
jgi:radical SAM superfamily enzyme YgiQ (UPF0313 family)